MDANVMMVEVEGRVLQASVDARPHSLLSRNPT